jgi:2-dehydropantoate 2-reductase
VRIAIVGAGAMGGIIASTLANGGAETTLVDVNPALVAEVNEHGLAVERGGVEQVVRVPATLDPSSVGVVDVVVFFVKCYHTEAAATLAAPLIGPNTIVATLQNGWGNGDVLVRHFDRAQVVVGVTYHSGTGVSPGRVRHTNTSDAPTLLGPFAGEDLANAEILASAIRAGGLRAEVPSDIGTEIWKKLVLNSSTLPTSALTRFTAGALTSVEPMKELVSELIRETVAVGRAKGFTVDEHERLETIHAALAGAGDGRASMLQDIEGGRRTEIDVINGAVTREGDRLGVSVPLNRAMVALISGYEAANGLV